jgi:hypothetical protein
MKKYQARNVKSLPGGKGYGSASSSQADVRKARVETNSGYRPNRRKSPLTVSIQLVCSYVTDLKSQNSKSLMGETDVSEKIKRMKIGKVLLIPCGINVSLSPAHLAFISNCGHSRSEMALSMPSHLQTRSWSTTGSTSSLSMEIRMVPCNLKWDGIMRQLTTGFEGYSQTSLNGLTVLVCQRKVAIIGSSLGRIIRGSSCMNEII